MLTLIRDDREESYISRFTDNQPGDIQVTKAIREITKLGLREARAISAAARTTWVVVPLVEDVDPDASDEAWAKLSALGVKLCYGRFLEEG